MGLGKEGLGGWDRCTWEEDRVQAGRGVAVGG